MSNGPNRQEARLLKRRLNRSIKAFKTDARLSTEYTCTICRYVGPFAPHGVPPRYGEFCPRCKSLARHRLFALAWEDPEFKIAEGARILHFAPEVSLRSMIEKGARSYQTADAFRDDTDLKLDIEDIELDDGAVDVIVCNRVLEHVDASRALAELFRILSPGGTAFLSVPITEGWQTTYRNDTITDPGERTLHFGQFDHVVQFGSDFRHLVRSAGFALNEFKTPQELFVRHGLTPGETQFIATKPNS